MKVEDFPSIQVDSLGAHRVVPEEALRALFRTNEIAKYLAKPPSSGLSLAFLVRVHRAALGIKQAELARLARLEQCQISMLENKLAYEPAQSTLENLCEVFGDSFRKGLIALSLLSTDEG